jgi:ACR3 family arsenite transporter
MSAEKNGVKCKVDTLSTSAIVELTNRNSSNYGSMESEEIRTGNNENQGLVGPEEKQLGFVDRFLTLWILSAMVLGVLIGYFSPSSASNINSWSTGSVNWPIAIGLIVMMFPPLARVKYERVWMLFSSLNALKQQEALEKTFMLVYSDPRCKNKCLCHDKLEEASEHHASSSNNNGASMQPANQIFGQLIRFSLLLNWIIGPFLMFFLGLAMLPDHIPYIRGLIMVGLARCIAMVIIWNDLAKGSPEYAAILVCFNSVFQIVFYSPYAYFFLSVFLPLFPLSGMNHDDIRVSFALVVESVAIYLGIPFCLGFGSWVTFNVVLPSSLGDNAHDSSKENKWKEWYATVFVPRTAPLTLIALLFTIIVMFILKGHLIVSIPLEVVRVAIPLCVYFTVMFVGVYYCCYRFNFPLEETITLSFTSASNNFELAIAVSIAVFGLNSPEAFVGVIGPLVEVPVMLAFVHLVKVLHRWWPTQSSNPENSGAHRAPDHNTNIEAFPSEKKVMFLCTGNSCRSHMAQGWTWYYHSLENNRNTSNDGLKMIAYSAGTSPKPNQPGKINPFAARVMLEYGIDLSDHRSKNVLDLENVDFDLVVTVCDDAAQECPTFVSPNTGKQAKVVHHAFDDPPRLANGIADEEEQLMIYRRVCEEIRVFVRDQLPNLLSQL